MKKETEQYMKEHPQLTLWLSVIVSPFAFVLFIYRELCFFMVKQFIRHFYLMPTLFVLLLVSFFMKLEV